MPASDGTFTFVYARISLDRRDGAGVDRQLQDGRSLCARRDWPIDREFVDNSRSAWRPSGRRPDYEQLLAAVAGCARCRVVAYKIDRLYRRPRELEDLIDLGDRGLKIVIATSAGGDFDLSTTEGRMFARQMVNWAASESDIKADRIRREKQQARERGLPHGGPRPFGWARRTIVLPDGTDKLTWDPMRHDAVESELIRDAVRDLLAGASLGDIARRWNSQGVSQPQTGRTNWTTDLVNQVVSNPRNAGLVGHRGEIKAGRPYRLYSRPEVVGKARWPPIVERADWEQLQAVLAVRGASGKVPKRRSLLTGLLICGCGATMVRTADHTRQVGAVEKYRKVWRCPTYTTQAQKERGEKSCGNNWIDAAGVEGLLVARALDKAESIDLAAIVEERGAPGREASMLTERLAELDERAAAAATSYGKGGITLQILEQATAEIERERKEVRAQLATLVDSAVLVPYLEQPGALREAWERITIDQKRELIRVLVGPVRILRAVRGRPHFDPLRVVRQGEEVRS